MRWRSYEAFRALRESDAWDDMPEARRRAVEAELRDFVLGGVALEVWRMSWLIHDTMARMLLHAEPIHASVWRSIRCEGSPSC